MTNNELFNEVKSISERLKKIFNPIYNSKIISEFYINLLDDLVYRNILENFFNNLTEENNKEYNLNIIDLEKIKNDFKKIQDNIKISSEDVDEVIFTKSYYYSSKSEIIERYPTLEKIFNKLEKIFDLDSIEDFVKNQKLEYVEGRNDYKITLNTLIFEKLIKNKRFKDLLELDQKDLAELIDIKELSKELIEKSMQITKWEIWKTYSTYTNRTFNIEELNKLSEILIKNNIVTSIFDTGCNVFWKDGEEVKKEKILDLNYLSENLGLLTKIPNYAAEGIYQFYLMWNSEERILKNMHYDYPYIKCFLSPINVTFTTGKTKTLYPQLTIYNTGVLNLTFRIMSPEQEFNYEVNSFIYNEINLNNLKIKELELPYEILESIKDFEIFDLENNKKTVHLGSFKHTFAKIDKFENLLDLTTFLVSVISYHISNKFKKFDYYNNYWLYSQSIYLLDYKNQPYHKEDIIENFREYLIQILYQIPFSYDANFSKKLPEDLRELNQYCLFIIKGMSLWISSKDELELFKEDINNERKVYEKQVLVEAINHFNLLINKLYEVSQNNDESYNEVIKLQKYLINFQRSFKTAYVSNFGEINNILNYCYKELKWKELINLSNELLNIKKNHQINRKNENLQYLVILIAIFTLCSQFMNYYPNRAFIFISINIILCIIFVSLIFKEKISHAGHVLRLMLKFFYNKLF